MGGWGAAKGEGGDRSARDAPYGGKGGKLKTCDNCGGRGHIAKECPSPQQCNACGSLDHMKDECPNKDKKCNVCGKFGHLQMKCYQAGKAGKGGSKGGFKDLAAMMFGGKTCDVCGQAGHLKRECPAAGKTCDICGMVGHLKATCKSAGGGKGKGKGKKTDKACNLCGEVGHLQANCPDADQGSQECWDLEKTGKCPRGDKCGWAHNGVPPNPKPEGGRGEKTCHLCGETGHLKNRCPN